MRAEWLDISELTAVLVLM